MLSTQEATALRAELAEIRAKSQLDTNDLERIGEIGKAVAWVVSEKARKLAVAEIGTPGDIAGVPDSPTTLGAALVKSAEYLETADAIRRGETRKFDHVIELKAAGDPVLESTGNNADAIAPTWLPRVYAPGLEQYPVRIQSVLNTRQLPTGATVNYPVVTTRTMTDQTSTAESENKAGAEFAFDFETATLQKWTAFSGTSEEIFQDSSTIFEYVNSPLLVMALQKEERYLAESLYTASTTAADGTGIGGLAGYDAVLEAMTMVRVAGGNPNAILINPNDWARLAVTRSGATNDGIYYSGGPYAAPSDNLWGAVREVQTPVVPEGTALVGDFNTGATLFRKGGPRLETSNAHDDWFRKNLIALRAEVRSVLGVHNPEFFVEVEIGS